MGSKVSLPDRGNSLDFPQFHINGKQGCLELQRRGGNDSVGRISVRELRVKIRKPGDLWGYRQNLQSVRGDDIRQEVAWRHGRL